MPVEKSAPAGPSRYDGSVSSHCGPLYHEKGEWRKLTAYQGRLRLVKRPEDLRATGTDFD